MYSHRRIGQQTNSQVWPSSLLCIFFTACSRAKHLDAIKSECLESPKRTLPRDRETASDTRMKDLTETGSAQNHDISTVQQSHLPRDSLLSGGCECNVPRPRRRQVRRQ